MNREEAIDILVGVIATNSEEENEALDMAIEALSAKDEWIPIRWHEITDEERERESYPKDWVVHIDCEMPCDGDEILVQTKSGYIRWDVCYEDGEFSLDSGWGWIEDIVAWMPLPEPYEEEPERTMEEFMYGQDLGDPEDGSL